MGMIWVRVWRRKVIPARRKGKESVMCISYLPKTEEVTRIAGLLAQWAGTI